MFDTKSIAKLRSWITANYTPDDETFAYRIATLIKEEENNFRRSQSIKDFFKGATQVFGIALLIAVAGGGMTLAHDWYASQERITEAVQDMHAKMMLSQADELSSLKADANRSRSSEARAIKAQEALSQSFDKKQRELEESLATSNKKHQEELAQVKKVIKEVSDICGTSKSE